MAQLTPAVVDRNGVVLTGAAATVTTGDTFKNTGKEFVVIKNGSGGGVVATLKFGPNGKVDGQSPADRTVNVAAGASAIIGPFPVGPFNDASDLVTIICAPVASVTIQVLTCPGV